MHRLRLLISALVVVMSATAFAGLPEGYTRASYTDTSRGINMEYAVYEPESEDPTSEFALFVLSGITDADATRFVNKLNGLDMQAYVYYVPTVEESMISTSIRTLRVDPDRIFFVGRDVVPDTDIFAAAVCYNTPEVFKTETMPVVYIYTDGKAPSDLGKSGTTLTISGSLDTETRYNILGDVVAKNPQTLTVIVENSPEAVPFYSAVLYHIAELSK